MNKIYFVRHAKPDYSIHDDLIRPLTDQGIKDSKELINFFKDKEINKIYSSPYKRAIDTIKEIAKIYALEIEIVDGFKERKISNCWIEDFSNYSRKQWSDFSYKLEDGESLKEVQDRNIKVLNEILENNDSQNIVIGTHGTALSTIIKFYDNTFNYDKFNEIKDVMPLIICMTFEGRSIKSITRQINK
ncbi:histidine phosphatase family protein [Hathewaya histolytica]|uniref:histidine phosphatase family protein n=1 Tax=Hathewaya histolytica TaxID=1498 RepID=UPI003B67AFE1